jgi:hypothetical protein
MQKTAAVIRLREQRQISLEQALLPWERVDFEIDLDA